MYMLTCNFDSLPINANIKIYLNLNYSLIVHVTATIALEKIFGGVRLRACKAPLTTSSY